MSTSLSDEIERILEQAVRSGQFKDKEQALAEALRLLGEQSIEPNGAALPDDAWRARFEEHVAHTPATAATSVDDSRESIYEGRGE